MLAINNIFLLLLTAQILTHSWLDCTDRRSDGGCAGFIRNRQEDSSEEATYKILNKDASKEICNPATQKDYKNYPSKYPMAKGYPGQTLYFDYRENGHVNLDKIAPDNKPRPGYYSVYWTGIPIGGGGSSNSSGNSTKSDSKSDTKSDSKSGGSAEMKLRGDLEKAKKIASAYFDDGECADITYNNRQGPKSCLGTYNIASGTEPGIYQFVWVWHFNKDPNGKGEEYTSCFDVEVLSKSKYDSEHANKKWEPYNPLGNTVVSKANINHLATCKEDGKWDPKIYNCKGGKLCKKPEEVCGDGKCYDPNTSRCCNDETLLPKAQSCDMLKNPFERIKSFQPRPYSG